MKAHKPVLQKLFAQIDESGSFRLRSFTSHLRTLLYDDEALDAQIKSDHFEVSDVLVLRQRIKNVVSEKINSEFHLVLEAWSRVHASPPTLEPTETKDANVSEEIETFCSELSRSSHTNRLMQVLRNCFSDSAELESMQRSDELIYWIRGHPLLFPLVAALWEQNSHADLIASNLLVPREVLAVTFSMFEQMDAVSNDEFESFIGQLQTMHPQNSVFKALRSSTPRASVKRQMHQFIRNSDGSFGSNLSELVAAWWVHYKRDNTRAEDPAITALMAKKQDAEGERKMLANELSTQFERSSAEIQRKFANKLFNAFPNREMSKHSLSKWLADVAESDHTFHIVVTLWCRCFSSDQPNPLSPHVVSNSTLGSWLVMFEQIDESRKDMFDKFRSNLQLVCPNEFELAELIADSDLHAAKKRLKLWIYKRTHTDGSPYFSQIILAEGRKVFGAVIPDLPLVPSIPDTRTPSWLVTSVATWRDVFNNVDACSYANLKSFCIALESRTPSDVTVRLLAEAAKSTVKFPEMFRVRIKLQIRKLSLSEVCAAWNTVTTPTPKPVFQEAHEGSVLVRDPNLLKIGFGFHRPSGQWCNHAIVPVSFAKHYILDQTLLIPDGTKQVHNSPNLDTVFLDSSISWDDWWLKQLGDRNTEKRKLYPRHEVRSKTFADVNVNVDELDAGFSDAVQVLLRSLEETKEVNPRPAWEQFTKKWGTHVVTGMSFGIRMIHHFMDPSTSATSSTRGPHECCDYQGGSPREGPGVGYDPKQFNQWLTDCQLRECHIISLKFTPLEDVLPKQLTEKLMYSPTYKVVPLGSHPFDFEEQQFMVNKICESLSNGPLSRRNVVKLEEAWSSLRTPGNVTIETATQLCESWQFAFALQDIVREGVENNRTFFRKPRGWSGAKTAALEFAATRFMVLQVSQGPGDDLFVICRQFSQNAGDRRGSAIGSSRGSDASSPGPRSRFSAIFGRASVSGSSGGKSPSNSIGSSAVKSQSK